MHLGVIKLGDRRRRHDVAMIDHDGIVVGCCDMSILGDIFIQLHMHQAVFGQTMQCPCFCFTGFESLHRLWDGYLINNDLTLRQRHLRDTVARLNQTCFMRTGGHFHTGRSFKESSNIHSIDRIIRSLINHF